MQSLSRRLSKASIVCCAAAVGGEKVAAAALNINGRVVKAAGRPGKTPTTVGNSVAPAGGGIENVINDETTSDGVAAVVAELTRRARVPDRRASAPLYFAFDHCFSVRGVGTILTGTVLAGEVKVSREQG